MSKDIYLYSGEKIKAVIKYCQKHILQELELKKKSPLLLFLPECFS